MRSRAVVVLSSALAVVVLSSGALMFLLWHNYQVTLDSNTELQSEISTLKNGGGSNGLGVQGVGAGSSLGTDTSPGAGTGSGSDSGSKTMLVKDFGIKFNVPTDLTDLTYSESPPASGFLQLTTQTLQKAYPCAAAGILGALFRYPKGQPLPANATTARAQKLVTAGGYDYYYLSLDKNPCTDKAAVAAISKNTSEITTSLATITAE